MALKITIKYPTEEEASKEGIDSLKKLEPVLKENLIRFTGKSWEHYEWRRDPDVLHQEYFKLVCVSSGYEVFSQTGGYFQDIDLDSFQTNLDFAIHENPPK